MLEIDAGNDSYPQFFTERGYFVQEGVLRPDEVETLRAAVVAIPESEAVRRKRGVYGIRNLFDICPAVRHLARRKCVRQFATAILGPGAFAVRAIYFDKIADANWSLFWHQDNVIAVKEQIEMEGFEAWSQKAGIWQVQPPAAVLANVVTVRIHLDDCEQSNGPLRVLPRSHVHGWLDDDLDHWKQNVDEVICTVGSGGVVTMCPLTLHASAPSENATHRRVIHLEYAADELPGELEWHYRI